jgi:hypothetical protein
MIDGNGRWWKKRDYERKEIILGRYLPNHLLKQMTGIRVPL